ncbi:MAG: hypothetical protein ACEPOZ_17395, partial [Marinifilaceae bacterium]
MSFELLSNFLLFCIGQSFVLMGVLAQKKFRKRHNQLLQGFLFLLSIYYLLSFIQIKELFIPVGLMSALAQPLELGIVILFFFYCKTLIGVKRKIGWLQVAKNVSFVIAFGWLFFSLFLFWSSVEREVVVIYPLVGKSVQLLVRSWYVFLPVVLLFQFRKDRPWGKFLLGGIRQGEDWIRLASMVVVIHGLFRISAVLCSGTKFVSMLEWIDLAFFLIITYLLSFIFISAPETMYPKLKMERTKREGDRKGRFSADEIQNFIQRMDSLMQNEKLFLDSEFSLNNLSDRMGLPVHHLSEIINQGHGLNFNDYINQFRVEEFKRLL